MNSDKKIPGGILRCFRFDLHILADSLWQYLLMIFLFSLLWNFTDTMQPINVVLLFTTVIAMVMMIQRYTVYFQQMVGFSLTRRSFLIGGLLTKLMYLLFSVLLCTAVGLLTRVEKNELILSIFSAVIGTLLFSFLGDLVGVLINRFNRVGLVIYIVCYIGLMLLAGILAGLMAASGISFTDVATPANLAVVAGAVVVVSAVIFVFDSLMLRRIAVR